MRGWFGVSHFSFCKISVFREFVFLPNRICLFFHIILFFPQNTGVALFFVPFQASDPFFFPGGQILKRGKDCAGEDFRDGKGRGFFGFPRGCLGVEFLGAGEF